MVEQLKTHGKAWGDALESLARANLDRFVAAHAEWTERLSDERAPDPPASGARRDHRRAAAGDGPPRSRPIRVTAERFATLRTNAERAKAIGYRMEVRQGVVLRMRALLLSDGRARAPRQATGRADERATYRALRDCEGLEITPTPPPPGTELLRAEPFPVFGRRHRARGQRAAGVARHPVPPGARTPCARKRTSPTAPRRVMMVYDGLPRGAGRHSRRRRGDRSARASRSSRRSRSASGRCDRSPAWPTALEIRRGRARSNGSRSSRRPCRRSGPRCRARPKVGSTAPALRARELSRRRADHARGRAIATALLLGDVVRDLQGRGARAARLRGGARDRGRRHHRRDRGASSIRSSRRGRTASPPTSPPTSRERPSGATA